MAEESVTCIITVDDEEKTLALDRKVALGEHVPVQCVLADGGQWPADGVAYLVAKRKGTLLARTNNLTRSVDGLTLEGVLSFFTTAAVAAFAAAREPRELAIRLTLWDDTNNTQWGVADELMLQNNDVREDDAEDVPEVTRIDSGYTHEQMTPAATWTIAHGLGRFPSVTIVDSGGSVVTGQVTYTDANTVTAVFSAAFAGKAYLS